MPCSSCHFFYGRRIDTIEQLVVWCHNTFSSTVSIEERFDDTGSDNEYDGVARLFANTCPDGTTSSDEDHSIQCPVCLRHYAEDAMQDTSFCAHDVCATCFPRLPEPRCPVCRCSWTEAEVSSDNDERNNSSSAATPAPTPGSAETTPTPTPTCTACGIELHPDWDLHSYGDRDYCSPCGQAERDRILSHPVEGVECPDCGYPFAYNGRGNLVCDCDPGSDAEDWHPDRPCRCGMLPCQCSDSDDDGDDDSDSDSSAPPSAPAPADVATSNTASDDNGNNSTAEAAADEAAADEDYDGATEDVVIENCRDHITAPCGPGPVNGEFHPV